MYAAPLDAATLDHILEAQLLVAWAGEGGEEPRLGWWQTELVSEFGGQDLFQRLTPHSWPWAVLQAVREAARRTDAARRGESHDADQLLTLFHLGFVVDEQLNERLARHKTSRVSPEKVFPELADVTVDDWSRPRFERWLHEHGTAQAQASPLGRRVRAAAGVRIETLVDSLVAALAPLPERYPMPHARSEA